MLRVWVKHFGANHAVSILFRLEKISFPLQPLLSAGIQMDKQEFRTAVIL